MANISSELGARYAQGGLFGLGWVESGTVTTTQILLGKARIQAFTTQTLLGRSRIQVTTTQNLLGKANIRAITNQTLLGKAAIRVTTTQNLLGKANIFIATANSPTRTFSIENLSRTIQIFPSR